MIPCITHKTAALFVFILDIMVSKYDIIEQKRGKEK
jgi:hypothetical protein